MGGVGRGSILCVPQNLSIRPIQAPTWSRSPWVSLFIVTSLALIEEELRVQTYLWIVAVGVIEPDSVMDNESRLFATDLTHPTIDGEAIVDEVFPCSLPCCALVELFLSHHKKYKK